MDNRATKRISVNRKVFLIVKDLSVDCFIFSISENGFQLIVPQTHGFNPDQVHGPVVVRLPVSSTKTLELSCIKVWSDGDIMGVRIQSPSDDYLKFYRDTYFKTKKELSHDPIAVIGMGCHYPGSPNLRSLWENILSRRREFRRLPDCRLPLADYYDADPDVPDKTYGTRAAVIDGFAFDWVKRGIPKSVVESSDIVHWLALDVAMQALEDAGYGRNKTPCDRTGVILGNTLTGEYSRAQNMRLRWPYVSKIVRAAAARQDLPGSLTKELLHTMEELYKSAFAPITEDTLAGNLSNTIAGRICNFLDLHGGGYTVDGACSSSLVAVATAATALSNGTLDVAVAGGIDISLDTFELVGFAKTGALTRGDMRVYDRKASGFIPGEGAGFVVLKRLQDARKHGNHIYAVLRGWGISSDGKGGITAPKAEAQALAIKRAYGKAGYAPTSVDFIEGHGTGTVAGDKAELEGVAIAMGVDPDEASSRLRSCGMTSLKSLIGHTKAASGIGGFIKAVLAVNRRVIPPTAGCSDPNTVFQNTARTLFPVLHGEVHDQGKVMRAGVSGMGFGGINCHVTVESGGPPAATLDTPLTERELMASYQETELFVLSAKDSDGLADGIAALKEIAFGMSPSEMPDLSEKTTQEMNASLPMRAAIVASTPEVLVELLDAALRMLDEHEVAEGTVITSPRQDVWIGNSSGSPRTGFLFPGQGSQQLNMGKTLMDRYPWASDLSGRVDRKLAENGYRTITETIYPPVDRAADTVQVKAWKRALSETEVAQPSICLNSVLWVQRLKRLGIFPTAVGGHSLGELTAFYAAGAFSEMELIEFAAFRGSATSAKTGEAGKMASLACDQVKAREVLDATGGYVVIANINSPMQTIISGQKDAVDEATERAASLGIDTRTLPVTNAFHSRFMAEAASVLAKDAPVDGTLKAFKGQLFSSMDGGEVAPGTDIRRHFSDQLTHTVDFVSLARNMTNACDMLIEVGPGRVLSDLAGSITSGTRSPCLPVEAKGGDDRSLNTVAACYFVKGGSVKWPSLFENRLVRPFVPASEKTFIVNPCERLDLGADKDVAGYIEATMPDKQRREAPGEARSLLDMGGAGPVDSPSELLALASEMTGFPVDSISLDHRLLDDLNLDSIKAGQFVAKAVKIYGAEGKIDPTGSANSSIAEIYESIKQDQQGTSTGAQPADAWVRDFRVEYIEAPIASSSTGTGDISGKKVLIVSDGPLEAGVKDALDKRGLDVASADYGSIPPQQTGGPKKYDYVIFLLPEPTGRKGPAAAEQVRAMAGRLHAIASTIVSRKAQGPVTTSGTTYAVVQRGDSDLFGLSGAESIESKGAAAFMGSIHQENPDERIRVIQFGAPSAGTWVGQMLDELLTPDTFASAVYDNDLVRRAPVLTPAPPALFTERAVKWTDRDVVLVTGGAKGITAECARAFAAKTGVRLAIVGSSENTEQNTELRQNLERYAEESVECRYYACDITDRDAVMSMASRIEEDLGPVTGFIHGAGLNRPRRVEQAELDDACTEIAPKVMGAVNILDALDGTRVKLVVALGSIIGVTGMVGNAWYAFSNEFLNLYLQGFKHRNPGSEVATCAYSVWAEVGMGAKMGSVENLSRMGINAIPVEKGVEHFLRLATETIGETQVITAGRLGAIDIMRAPLAGERGRFTEDVLFFEKGVEIETRATLTSGRDRYLEDHVFRGTLLFPTVFGVEAMQQAVMAVADVEPGSIELVDVNLSYPITVEPGGETEIHIRALMLENDTPGEPRRVKASVTVDQTGFGKNHFEATFVLAGERAPESCAIDAPDAALDIDPEEDLYGHMLFQGPSFHRISRILSMTDNRCVFESSIKAPDPELDAPLLPLISGDPYFRDTLLQSVQIILPNLVALPVGIEKWELSCRDRAPGSYTVAVDIRERTDDSIVSDVTVAGPDGFVVERIHGYRVKIIEVIEDAPALDDLIQPDRWDEEHINRLAVELCAKADTAPVTLSLSHIPGLPRMARAERHSIERDLFRKGLKAILSMPTELPEDITVDWTEEGKPYLPGNFGMAVSCSHDSKLLLCSVGTEPQGCDVETVEHRDQDEWRVMLGKDRQQLLDRLCKDGDSFDMAATRLWCAVESLRKATDLTRSGLGYGSRSGDSVVFTGEDDMAILTFPVKLLRGRERVVAIATKRNSPESTGVDSTEEPQATAAAPSAQLSDTGPLGQRVFSTQFQLGLRDNSSVSGGVNFTNYAGWLGNVREAALKPIGTYISDEFYKGHFMVTNLTDTKIIRHVRNHETVEARLWVDRIFGYKDSSLTLKVEWSKVTPDGAILPIAHTSHQVSWIKVVGHGVVEPVECPKFFAGFLRDNNFAPPRRAGEQAENIPDEPLSQDTGELVREFDLIGAGRRVAAETTFDTTTQNSNLAQNVYFSNYFTWQGHLVDRYLFGLDKKTYMGMSPEAQFATVRSTVEHLREAMPFDTIAVTMQVERVRRRSIDLYFEYFRQDPGGGRTKLAYGHNTLIWTSVDETDGYVTKDIPEVFINSILQQDE